MYKYFWLRFTIVNETCLLSPLYGNSAIVCFYSLIKKGILIKANLSENTLFTNLNNQFMKESWSQSIYLSPTNRNCSTDLRDGNFLE